MLTQYVKKKAAIIEDQDRVIINGIYVGRNYKNNKYIIQLIKPDFAKLPHETVKNDQRIEIDAKYVKRVPKRGVEEANLPLSLTDRESINQTTPTPTPESILVSNNGKSTFPNTNNNNNNLLTERNIIDEWNNIIGDNDESSMEVDASETCDAWTLNDCDSCKRILFCLSYYRLWIVHKYNKQKGNDNDNKSELIDNNVYVEFLIDFINLLSYYSSTSMLNDFHHIKQFHIGGNNNNSSMDNKQDIFEYFKKEMGICNYMNCRSYSRNNRDRNECTESNKLRRNLYFIDEKAIIEKAAEITETNIQQLFDMIHCTLLHPKSFDDTTQIISKSNKFVTDIDGDNDKKQKEEDTDKKEGGPQTAVLSSYGFGAQFKYHDKSQKNYIEAKYSNLKNEILNNKLYRISDFDFESLSEKAKQYLSSYRGRLLKARKQSQLNELCKIKPNDNITLNHVIVLMLYTNMDDLQREFKKGCRYLITDNQKLEPVKQRNREIANWCRLLWESITFYGESITKKQAFYHGLNCKLLFTSVIAAFNCPTSTTVNKSVAFNFSTENGIIVQLTKFQSLDSHYLDVSDLSDYPNEQERLFFQAQLGFEDIIYNNTSNKYFIKCLNLFQNIFKGNFFTHNSKIFKNKHQKTLIKMMETVLMDNNINIGDIDNDGKKTKKKKKIPLYMQQLFEHYCKSLKQTGNIIWINKEEFSKLNENIRKHLSSDDKSDKNNNTFIKWLQSQFKTKIKYPRTAHMLVANNSDDNDDSNNYLDLFWDRKSVLLPTISYSVNDGNGKKEKINLKLKLKKGITKNDNTVMITVKIGNKTLPDHVKKIKCDFGVFCPQIQWSMSTTTTVSKSPQAIPLCDSIKLEGLDAFEWKLFVKFRARIASNNLVYNL